MARNPIIQTLQNRESTSSFKFNDTRGSGSARRAKVLLSKCREEPYDNVRGTRSVSGGLLGGKNSLRARLGGRSPDCRRHYRYLRRTSGALPD